RWRLGTSVNAAAYARRDSASGAVHATTSPDIRQGVERAAPDHSCHSEAHQGRLVSVTREDDEHARSPPYGPDWGVHLNIILLYPTARPSAPIAKTGLVK